MKMPKISLLEWQKKYGTENACLKAMKNICWLQGFQCHKCGSEKSCFIVTRKLHQCSRCRHQVSIMADTLLFHCF